MMKLTRRGFIKTLSAGAALLAVPFTKASVPYVPWKESTTAGTF